MPENVLLKDRAIATAGFANEVEAVNQYAAVMYRPTSHGIDVRSKRRPARIVAIRPNAATASANHWAPPVRAFIAVTLPLILPSIAAGWMLAFTLSLDDLVIASFTTGPGSATLPIRIYSEVRLGVKPEINAICTLVVAAVALVIVAASLASKLSSEQGESAAPL